MLPRPDKVATGGEDAFFIAPDGASVGVADGVGGWADVGVDPAQHSRLLMSNCRSYCEALANDVREEEAGRAQPPMETPADAAQPAEEGAAGAPPAQDAAATPAEPQVGCGTVLHAASRARAAPLASPPSSVANSIPLHASK